MDVPVGAVVYDSDGRELAVGSPPYSARGG
jgi:hypothetical protein